MICNILKNKYFIIEKFLEKYFVCIGKNYNFAPKTKICYLVQKEKQEEHLNGKTSKSIRFSRLCTPRFRWHTTECSDCAAEGEWKR